jgi:hypothetical protein
MILCTVSTERTDQQLDEIKDAAAVPADFPRPANLSAVPGAQEKFVMTRYKRRFYSLGCTPHELLERWNACEDLARQLSAKSLESKSGKSSHM